ncbi:MAG: single-stranded DNA-binding protein [Deltaproteobacteria bacterium]|nr:single-stranded DNA-binding protein [Deltaproteobacteria bacterium]MBW2257259.1 single-stranded DNA-binding protein [Deltaproteobacteria bacterium]
MTVLDAARRLREAVADYPRSAPVGLAATILNPLDYAWDLHRAYIERYAPAGHTVEAMFLGMNPGPWGMAQSGVPFGEVGLVRSFLRLEGAVKPPKRIHPKRPIIGLDCPRKEVSGQRLWGTVRDCFGTPEAFFERFYVANYCPLAFQSETGANIVPEKMPAAFLAPCLEASSRHLVEVVEALRPRTVIGIGKWAEKRAREVLADQDVRIGFILHPSPASPAANRGWAEQVLSQLRELGHPWD